MLLTLSPLYHTHSHTVSATYKEYSYIHIFTLFLHKNYSAPWCQSRVKTGLFLTYFNIRAVITSWHHISLFQNTTFTLYYSNRNTLLTLLTAWHLKNDQWQCWSEPVSDAAPAAEAEHVLRSSQTFMLAWHTSQAGNASSINTSCDIYISNNGKDWLLKRTSRHKVKGQRHERASKPHGKATEGSEAFFFFFFKADEPKIKCCRI